MSSGRTHLERHSSLKAWIAMRVIFTDIKQKGNCWNGSGTRSVATQVLPSVFPVSHTQPGLQAITTVAAQRQRQCYGCFHLVFTVILPPHRRGY